MTNTERLAGLLGEATAGPWAYRPQEYDDWGTIRTTVATEDGWHPIVAVSRGDEEHGLHRANGTDPYEKNGRLIVEAVNAIPALLSRLAALEADNARLRAHLTFAVKLLGAFPALGATAQVEAMRDTLAQAVAGEGEKG